MKTFFISDHHFAHANILTFRGYDGELIRPNFLDANEMDEYMIEKHNSVVSQEDKVYFLGDVCFSYKTLASVMPRLNGRLRLILGNHDMLKMSQYSQFFQSIYSARHLPVGDKLLLLTHYPIHPYSNFNKKDKVNVHGHIHEKNIDDPRYFCVCVEHLDYTPIELDDLLARIEAEREEYR